MQDGTAADRRHVPEVGEIVAPHGKIGVEQLAKTALPFADEGGAAAIANLVGCTAIFHVAGVEGLILPLDAHDQAVPGVADGKARYGLA